MSKDQAKLNCWELKKCGREPDGARTHELGICPAAVERRLEGVNSGRKGGRSCWALTGTLCGGEVQGIFAAKIGNCLLCEFYQLVRREEGAAWLGSPEILAKLKVRS